MKNKPLIRLAVLLTVSLVGVFAAVAFKSAQRAQRAQALLDEFILDLKDLQTDEAGLAYAEGLARAAHETAVAKAFRPSGLTGGTFDVNVYQRTAVDWMIARARADGSTHVAEALEEFRDAGSRLDLSVPAIEPTEAPSGR
jgi:hypothetical protein